MRKLEHVHSFCCKISTEYGIVTFGKVYYIGVTPSLSSVHKIVLEIVPTDVGLFELTEFCTSSS